MYLNEPPKDHHHVAIIESPHRIPQMIIEMPYGEQSPWDG